MRIGRWDAFTWRASPGLGGLFLFFAFVPQARRLTLRERKDGMERPTDLCPFFVFGSHDTYPTFSSVDIYFFLSLRLGLAMVWNSMYILHCHCHCYGMGE